MKKLPLFLFILSVSIFTSCEKDAVNENVVAYTESTLNGTWQLTQYNNKDGVTTVESDASPLPITFTYSAIGTELDMTMTFDSETKKATSEGSFKIELTTEFLGEKNVQTTPATSAIADSDWELKDDTIIFTTEGVETVYQILSLTDSKLELQYNLELIEGTVETAKTTSTSVLLVTMEK